MCKEDPDHNAYRKMEISFCSSTDTCNYYLGRNYNDKTPVDTCIGVSNDYSVIYTCHTPFVMTRQVLFVVFVSIYVCVCVCVCVLCVCVLCSMQTNKQKKIKNKNKYMNSYGYQMVNVQGCQIQPITSQIQRDFYAQAI